MSVDSSAIVKRIAILPGDPSGIGYETAAKALHTTQTRNTLLQAGIVPVLFANAMIFDRAIQLFAPGLEVTRADRITDANDPSRLWIVDIGQDDIISDFKPGMMSAKCATIAHQAIQAAIHAGSVGAISGIATGPIQKSAMRLAGVPEIGHTEMFAKGFGIPDPITLFITRSLRIFFFTRHMSLRQAIDALTPENLFRFCIRVNDIMPQLGFKHPKLALAALNPHASDGGQFGTEEREILVPVADAARGAGINLSNPISADSVFMQAATGKWDAVISLYHDQGHIAAKTYDFERTISATLGLPVLRTSVDHGTAFDIAWTGEAQHLSMMTAIETLAKYL